MKVAIYARVSTVNGGQNPDTQLLPLREYCAQRGWEVVGEYIDRVSGAKETRPA
jgi:DNA invertase Pin-like site-specific DNA recombinase